MSITKTAAMIGGFIFGAAVGSVASYIFMNKCLAKKYDERLDEEIASMRNKSIKEATDISESAEESATEEKPVNRFEKRANPNAEVRARFDKINENIREKSFKFTDEDRLYLEREGKLTPDEVDTVIRKLNTVTVYGDGEPVTDSYGNGITETFEEYDEIEFTTVFPGTIIDYIDYDIINALYYSDHAECTDEYGNEVDPYEVGNEHLPAFINEYGGPDTPIFVINNLSNVIYNIRLARMPYFHDLDKLSEDDSEYWMTNRLLEQGVKEYDGTKILDLSKFKFKNKPKTHNEEVD